MSQRNENFRDAGFLGVGIVVFALLIYRLVQLQVVQGPEFRAKSEDNRIRFVEMLAPRGVIRDRRGALLVSNRPSYTCYGIPRDLYKDSLAVEKIGFALAGDPAEIREKVLKPFRTSFRPQRLRRDLPYTLLARFEETRDEIPGSYLEIEPKRFYPGGIAPTPSATLPKLLMKNSLSSRALNQVISLASADSNGSMTKTFAVKKVADFPSLMFTAKRLTQVKS
ncbi:MAG: hypothetical protein IPP40_05455 [bacterium]|nr:hypothetical protein [bacterium]